MGIGMIELLVMLFFLGIIPFVIAFIDIVKNEFEGNNKLIWLLAVIFVPLIGSIAYLIVGRKQRVKTG